MDWRTVTQGKRRVLRLSTQPTRKEETATHKKNRTERRRRAPRVLPDANPTLRNLPKRGKYTALFVRLSMSWVRSREAFHPTFDVRCPPTLASGIDNNGRGEALRVF